MLKHHTINKQHGIRGYAMVAVLLMLLVVSLWGARHLLTTKETLRQGRDQLRMVQGGFGADSATLVAQREIETFFRADGLDYGTAAGSQYENMDYNLLLTNDSVGYLFTRNKNSGGWQRCDFGSAIGNQCVYKKGSRGDDIHYSMVIAPASEAKLDTNGTLYLEYWVSISATGRKEELPEFNGDASAWHLNLPNAAASNLDVATYLGTHKNQLDTRRYSYESRFYSLPGEVVSNYLGRIRIGYNETPPDKWMFVPNEADGTLTIVNTKFWQGYPPIAMDYPNPCKVWVDPYFNKYVFVSHCPVRNGSGGIDQDDDLGTYGPDTGENPMHTTILSLDWDSSAAVNNDDDMSNDDAIQIGHLSRDSVGASGPAYPFYQTLANRSIQSIDFSANSLKAVAVDKFGVVFNIDFSSGAPEITGVTDMCARAGHDTTAVPHPCEAADRVYNYVDGRGGLYNDVVLKPDGKAYISLVQANKVVRYDAASDGVDWTFDAAVGVSSTTMPDGSPIEEQIFEGMVSAKTSSSTYGLLINNRYRADIPLADMETPKMPFGVDVRKLDEVSGMVDSSTPDPSVDQWWKRTIGLTGMTGTTHRRYDPDTLAVIEDPFAMVPRFGMRYSEYYETVVVAGECTTGGGGLGGGIGDIGQVQTCEPDTSFQVKRYHPLYSMFKLYKVDLAAGAMDPTPLPEILGLPFLAFDSTAADGTIGGCMDENGSLYLQDGACSNPTDTRINTTYAIPAGYSKQIECKHNRCVTGLTKIGRTVTVDIDKGYGSQVVFPGCETLPTDSKGGVTAPCQIDSQPHFSELSEDGFNCVTITGVGKKLWWHPCAGDPDPADSLQLATTNPTEVNPWVTYPVDARFAEKPGERSDQYKDAPTLP